MDTSKFNDKSTFSLYEKTLMDVSFNVANKLYVDGENLSYSPASLTYAMAMLLEGTDGKSQNEIIVQMFDPEFIGDPQNALNVSSFVTELLSKNSQSIQKYLSIANYFYSQKGFVFQYFSLVFFLHN